MTTSERKTMLRWTGGMENDQRKQLCKNWKLTAQGYQGLYSQ